MNKKPIAVVTGANRGIGLEISRQLAAKGVCVVVTSRSRRDGERARDTVARSSGAETLYHPLDVTSDASTRALAEFLKEKFGRLDILVNNAGILFDDDREQASILTQSADRFGATMETNFYGPLRLCQHLAPLIVKSAAGRIVNVSSGLGLLTDMGDRYPAYGVSKTALNALTRMVAAATREEGVLVNAMCPGLVATDMGGPAGRPVEEGADTAVWLALLPEGGPTGGCFRDREPVPW